ncbi:MAG: 16S rRNA (uracil(1498)-N(3))-methyltransferase [Bacteroidales bacterium]|jgi:16S rRNA (uracil1498-N3)-methyltransferase|nr:16S rRNA (uracil(1498)-N(3))-methyltransferase [Bacteroidales bacterium]MDD4703188.1 16S rRNA (uracil(1498)-N(3))-methyltransferase [Bacteroidales bacterium]
MNLFYSPLFNPLQIFTLDKEESLHCVKVLRLKEGDFIHITDGNGNLHKAQIIEALPRSCSVKAVESFEEFEKRDYYLHIAIAPTKNTSRIEWFLEKATEIGIDEITPIICENSERAVIKLERLEKILISAMKQSLKAYLPIINPPINFSELISSVNQEKKLIATCNEDGRKLLKDIYSPKENVFVAIGPEGDFSKKEIEEATKYNFHKISLGKERLRTETAGVYISSTIHLLNQ